MAKKGTLGWWKGKAWDALSLKLRTETPVCEICLSKPSTCVHHIIKKARGNAVYFLVGGEPLNLLCLCNGCHMNWHNMMSPGERDEIIARTKGAEFQKVEDVKNTTVKYRIHDYQEWIEEWKVEP